MKKMNQKEWIVCLGGKDWWYHNHADFGIQMMKQLSKKTNILFICSIGMRMPSLRHDALFWQRIWRKLKSVSRLLQQVTPRLYVYSPLPLPLYQYSWGRALNTILLRLQFRAVYLFLGIKSPIIWVNTPTAWPIISAFPKSGLIYQRTDDFAAYQFDNFNADYVKKIDKDLVCSADLVLHVSEELHHDALTKTRDSLLLTQGVDANFFKPQSSLPDDLANIPHPIIGYIGSMEKHKFDTQLILDVTRKLPNCSFVLIGPSSANIDVLKASQNIYFLGTKNHGEIPSYVYGFDVCILPTARTEWGLKCRPIKLMEYLAANKPVLATQTPASEQFLENIFVSNDSEEWCKEIYRLTLLEQEPNDSANSIKTQLKSWDEHAEQIWDHILKKDLL